MPAKKKSPRSDASQAAEAMRDFVVDKAAAKLEQTLSAQATKLEHTLSAKATKAARQQEKLSAKTARAARHLDRLSTQLEMLDIWTRTQPSGRRPRFTRDQIAAAAVRIADEEGAEALSMRRLAAELDAGTMTLYHYIRTKDELLTLVLDAIMGEVVVPADEELPDDWRAAMTVIADRSRAALQRHPWILDITDDPAIGPNSVRHFDQSLEAVSSLAIDLPAKLDIVTVVDEYVFGYCLNQRNNVQPESGFDKEMVGYVKGLLATGDYPSLGALADDVGLRESWEQIEAHQRDGDRFARNLDRLLDGIQADLDRAATS